MKYILVDEFGEPFLFRTQKEITRFLGVAAMLVRQALDDGDYIQGYTIDELI